MANEKTIAADQNIGDDWYKNRETGAEQTTAEKKKLIEKRQ